MEITKKKKKKRKENLLLTEEIWSIDFLIEGEGKIYLKINAHGLIYVMTIFSG